MPPYPNTDQVMKISAGTRARDSKSSNWEAEYFAHCAEKERELAEKDAVEARQKVKTDENSDPEDWAIQYHNYCIEKEAKLAEKDLAEKDALQNQVGSGNDADTEDWTVQYQNYCIEKEAKLAKKEKE